MAFSAYNIDWKQDEANVEIRIPLQLPPTIHSRELSIAVGDSDVLIVKLRNTKLWQSRLHAAIEPEVEWHVENGRMLILEITKKNPDTWTALLNVPLHPRDPFILSKECLDQRLLLECPSMPREDGTIAEVPASVQLLTLEPLPEPVFKVAEEDAGDAAFVSVVQTIFKVINATDGPTLPAVPMLPDISADVKALADKVAAKLGKKAEEKTTEETNKKDESEIVLIIEGNAASEKDEDSLDGILNDAINEVTCKAQPTEAEMKPEETSHWDKSDKKVENNSKRNSDGEVINQNVDIYDMRIRILCSEIEDIKKEQESISKTHDELTAKLEKVEDRDSGEEYKTLTHNIEITNAMLKLSQELRQLRSLPNTIDNFLKVQQLDIRKARLNISSMGESEDEQYQSDEEKSMTGLEVYKRALEALQNDISQAIHLFRIAAIKKHHSPSALMLFSIYARVPASTIRGVQIMLSDALRNENIDPINNTHIGNLFNAGERYFPPHWALAVYFLQRAAMLGYPSALINLGLLHIDGTTDGATMVNPSKLYVNEDIGNYFINKALERGNTTAALVRAIHLTTGTCGCKKDISLAKKYYQRACLAQPNIKFSKDVEICKITIGNLQKLLDDESHRPAAVNDDDIPDVRVVAPNTITTTVTQPDAAAASTAASRLEVLDRCERQEVAPITGMKKTVPVASGAKSRQMWESVARWGVSAYAVYCIAFPIRVMALPYFYESVATLFDMLGISSSQLSGMV